MVFLQDFAVHLQAIAFGIPLPVTPTELDAAVPRAHTCNDGTWLTR
jgi:hypothetical protein